MLASLWAALAAWWEERVERARRGLRRLLGRNRRPDAVVRVALDVESLAEASAHARRLADNLEDAAEAWERLPDRLRTSAVLAPGHPMSEGEWFPAPGRPWELGNPNRKGGK